jgi:hypothetical protein
VARVIPYAGIQFASFDVYKRYLRNQGRARLNPQQSAECSSLRPSACDVAGAHAFARCRWKRDIPAATACGIGGGCDCCGCDVSTGSVARAACCAGKPNGARGLVGSGDGRNWLSFDSRTLSGPQPDTSWNPAVRRYCVPDAGYLEPHGCKALRYLIAPHTPRSKGVLGSGASPTVQSAPATLLGACVVARSHTVTRVAVAFTDRGACGAVLDVSSGPCAAAHADGGLRCRGRARACQGAERRAHRQVVHVDLGDAKNNLPQGWGARALQGPLDELDQGADCLHDILHLV